MLLIDDAYRPDFSARGWNDAREVLAANGRGEAALRTTVIVRQQTMPAADGSEVPVFFKTYEYPPTSFEFWGRASKARCEFLNYEAFVGLGIRCAERIACGEMRDWMGRLQRAFIITRAIPGAMTLPEFAKQHPRAECSPHNRSLRSSVLEQVATMTRQIHDAGFHHQDLVWRNILVTLAPGDDPKVWWIDCPRGGFDRWSPWRRRKRIKDLASLDKAASRHCSRAERLRFLCAYLQEPRTNDAVRKLAKEVVMYRRQRWPEDWNGE